MFDHTTNADELDESTTTDARYAQFTTEDGVVLYDRENQAAWIESDTTVTPREMV